MQKVRVYECWTKKSKNREGVEVTYHCVRLEDANTNYRYPSYFSFPISLCNVVEKNAVYDCDFNFNYILVDRVDQASGEILKGKDQAPTWRIVSFSRVKNVS